MPVGNKFASIAPVFTFQLAGSTTVTDLSAYAKDLKIPQTMKSADATGYGNTNTQYVATIKDLSMEWTTFLETGNVIEDLLVPGAAGTVTFGPNGSTAGMRKYTLVGFISDFSPDYSFSNVAMAPTKFMPTANITRATYP